MVCDGVLHVVEDGGEQAAHADERGLVFFDGIDEGLVLHVHAQVDDLDAVASS